MFKFILINSIAVSIIVVLSLCLVILLASMAPEAKAQVLPIPLLQGDMPLKVPACALQGWPHYQPHCQFDLRIANAEPRTVRIIALR
jgi:hypothetical protein